MDNWFHAIAGRYNPRGRWVGLDYAKLLGDRHVADSIMAHEMAHAAMSQETDFGQATHVILNVNENLQHLNDAQKDEIGSLIIGAQDFVQEGFATLFQVARLGSLTQKGSALAWARRNLPDYYLEKLEKLKFVLEFTPTYRDYFTKKISYLTMETRIRRDAPKLNLLSTPETLKGYLEDEEKNPDKRLEKLIDVLRYKKWMLTKPIPDIAELCGVKYFEPTTKEEVAEFLNYATGLTGKLGDYSAADIGDTPQGAETFIQTGRDMIIGNMNIDFTQNAEALFNLNDFLHYSDVMDLVFVNPAGDLKHKDTIRTISGYEPEVNIAGVLRAGGKYLTVLSKEKAAEILNNDLKNASMLVKWGGYDIYKDRLIWSETARTPDLVVYNNAQQMKDVFEKLTVGKQSVRFAYLYVGAMKDHPVQSLLIRVEGQHSLHFVNSWGNRAILGVLDLIRDRSRVITNDELRGLKKHINNLLSFWMNMHQDIDWVETMIDGNTLIFRNNS